MVGEVFKKRVGNYLLGRTIGEVLPSEICTAFAFRTLEGDLADVVQGTYAKVKFGQHYETDEPVAIKVFLSVCAAQYYGPGLALPIPRAQASTMQKCAHLGC